MILIFYEGFYTKDVKWGIKKISWAKIVNVNFKDSSKRDQLIII